MASYLVSGWNSASDSSGSEDEENWHNNSQTHLNMSHSHMTSQDLETTITSMITLADPCPFFQISHLKLCNNLLREIPEIFSNLTNLQNIDLSNNAIKKVSDAIIHMTGLTHLILRNNQIEDEDLPKDLISLKNLRTVNLSGNQLTCVPPQLFDLASLRNLFLGANNITEVNPAITRLRKLRLLYLGGNKLTDLPQEIGELANMHVLLLSDNRLRRLPDSICQLKKLQCLHLHRNNLTTLPHGLVHIKSLSELSLRENPLVMRFIRDMEYQPASLLELAGRSVRLNKIPYGEEDLPASLNQYLTMAHECVNPSCQGVYFDHRVEHVKFSDFCGKYKIPLLQYLCSPRCREQLPEYAEYDVTDETADQSQRLKRVLLG